MTSLPSTNNALEDQPGCTAGEAAILRDRRNVSKKPAADELEQVLQYTTRVHNWHFCNSLAAAGKEKSEIRTIKETKNKQVTERKIKMLKNIKTTRRKISPNYFPWRKSLNFGLIGPTLTHCLHIQIVYFIHFNLASPLVHLYWKFAKYLQIVIQPPHTLSWHIALFFFFHKSNFLDYNEGMTSSR